MALDPGALYRDHADAVWRYARGRVPSDADAEDVTSDVFARAIRSTDRYRPELGTQRAWLIGIARHSVGDWWRRRREEPSAELREVDQMGVGGGGDDPPSAAEQADEADALRRMLDALSDREREAVALRFGAELPSPEIGEALGISPTAARMLVHRAVTKLREVMGHG